MTFNGESLADKYLRKYGFRDSASRIRVLEWINDIVRDICSNYAWNFLRTRVKKNVPANTQEVDISPTVPSKPTVAVNAADGGFQINDKIKVKTTFLLLDDTREIENSIESKGSISSNTIVITEANKSIKITGIAIYPGAAIRPNIIHRRIYVSVNGEDFALHATIEDNTTVEAVILTQVLSEVTPPEMGMAQKLVSDPFINNFRRPLVEATLDELTSCDVNLERVGTPQYYVKLTPTKILLYPMPSDDVTLYYFVQKIPSMVVDDDVTPLQFPGYLKEVIESGVTWKYYEDKDQNGQESKKINYDNHKSSVAGNHASDGAKFGTVKEVF